MNTENINKDPENPKNKAQDVVALVDNLLEGAMNAGASDIHFEPTGAELVVKYRLDGVLETVEKLPKFLSENIIARLKVLGGLLTYRNDIPQEGRIEITGHNSQGVLDERLAVFPTIHGQRAVVRIFYQHRNLTELQQLGFSEAVYKTLKSVAFKNQGLLLLTGPAGSGKSTTLAAMLRFILRNFPGKSIVTLEDPVEIRVEGVTQVQITPFGEMTFPTALRSLLRQDPQVLMIGEIRDAETAKIAIEAALTGHFLMSTMHSGMPAAGFLRLLEMGIEPYQVTSSVCAILNQRLVRKLCDKCKKKNEKTATFEIVGCKDCLNAGYKGRVLISEIVELNSELRKAIVQKTDLEKLETLLKNKGHTNMLADGKRLIREGVTTVDELNRVCGMLESE
jgi:type II secretory ATPase GspE/PulE/Tfp pilus assembly ATPase PilB-like protein